MTFPSIADSAGPADYSWEVTLFEGQDLKSVDDQHAAVYYEDGEHVAFSIAAVQAHDADGTDVPTSLAVSEPNVLTLTVHHRAGDPAANGAPFDYPVVAGAGWEGGFKTATVEMPPPVGMSEPVSEPAAAEACLVPNVKGRTLKGAKLRLRKASCKIGKVRKRKGATARTGEVIRQGPRPGLLLPVGTAVNVTLGD
ncbi:MAG TPA: PASTA domain-containing protein [Solirubrobacterales bacterium]|nr:PASTA domain-containing protein [Solirubrobacterales bacterium]